MEIIEKRPIRFESKNEQLGVVKTIKAIKKFLTKKRWVQGEYETEDGNYCLIGAARKLDGPYETLVIDLMHYEARTRGFTETENFNDAPKRTYEHIVNFLNKSLNRAEKGVVVTE